MPAGQRTPIALSIPATPGYTVADALQLESASAPSQKRPPPRSPGHSPSDHRRQPNRDLALGQRNPGEQIYYGDEVTFTNKSFSPQRLIATDGKDYLTTNDGEWAIWVIEPAS